MKNRCLVVLLMGSLFPALAIAQTSWGVDAYGGVFDRFGTTGFTSGPSNPSESGTSDDSGGGGIQADLAAGIDSRGRFASHSALLDGLSAFIELGTYATNFHNAATTGEANAVDRFTYHGSTTATFTLTADLSGHFINSENDPSPYSGNFANVFVIFDDVDDYYSVTVGQYEAWTNWIEANLEQSDNATVIADSVTFDLDPGDTFSVYANAWSWMFGEDGVADALATIKVGFSTGPVDDLVREGIGISVIPESRFAGPLITFASAMSALFCRRR